MGRTGEERKGQERTGEEKTGQDRKGGGLFLSLIIYIVLIEKDLVGSKPKCKNTKI